MTKIEIMPPHAFAAAFILLVSRVSARRCLPFDYLNHFRFIIYLCREQDEIIRDEMEQ